MEVSNSKLYPSGMKAYTKTVSFKDNIKMQEATPNPTNCLGRVRNKC